MAHDHRIALPPAGEAARAAHASGTPDPSARDVRFNAFVNIMDGAFFGSALGFASFITIIPLFVSQLTDSAILIGLVPAIHVVGWQLPQLLTSGQVQRLGRYKPMVLAMTIHERLPYFGLALLAWFLPGLEHRLALVLTFGLLIWQGLGGGWTATVWQTMIGKIIPGSWRGGFFGVQASAANLLASGAAVIAGQFLERFSSPLDFTACFLLAGLGMVISFAFLAATREQDHIPHSPTTSHTAIWQQVRRILASNRDFRRFLIIRMFFQIGMAAFSYYAVYAVGELGAGAGMVGWLTGTLIFSEMIANPLLGALGDRRTHRLVLLLGAVVALTSTSLAGWLTSVPGWFFIFALAGVASVVGWTTTIVLSLEFGTQAEQATYIGMSNTLVAPATLAAPFMAGWIVESLGYPAMFRCAALVCLAAALLSYRLLGQPSPSPAPAAEVL
jgi:MFS family permease